MIVHIMIGNSDDKLTQAEWAEFVAGIDGWIGYVTDLEQGQLHGRWFAAPDVPWQSACWCVEITGGETIVDRLKAGLCGEAETYRQDSIAWHEVPQPVLLRPPVRLLAEEGREK